MDTRCKIEMLGGLRVEQDSRVITRFRTQKTGALLAYLAFYPRSHPREQLITIFWPDHTPEAGLNSLSTALSSLRHQLEPPGVPRGAVLVADRYSVHLNPAAITTDVSSFETALASARTAGSPMERSQFLSEAVQLYCGELLPGYYEEWVLTEQRRLADQFFEAVRQLIAILEKAGDLDQALDLARRAVSAEPLREEAHQDLIRLYIAAGQSAAALRQYNELAQLLKQELDQEPSASTQALLDELQTESKDLLQGRAVEGAAPLPPATLISPPSAASTDTVTFLLTDIEGSTATWERTGAAYRAALDSHHALLRQQFRQHGGREFKEVGDAFLVAFPSAGDALACAVAAQQVLSRQAWPEEVGALRVRMALHTGDVQQQEGDYHSLVLHRASRMLTAAHGGQILCSETTATLLRRDLQPGMDLVDLGIFRLRDVPASERLFQVVYPDMLQRQFPPLRAEAGYAANLPLQFTRFFGRETEIARLETMLLSEQTRLVTLTGPGGSGKTRLALETAKELLESLNGAVWFVPLADLTDARLIVEAVIDALQLPRSVHLQPMEQVVQALSNKPCLLVLDNFEQIVNEGASIVQTLLERVPTLTCLVTSRQLLGLPVEQEFVVSPLPVPLGASTPEQLTMFESVQLFIDRAQTVLPDFQVTNHNASAVAELCDRLEGIPLALELAAARAQVLTPAQMLERLPQRFDLLVSRQRTLAERHRTLRAAIDWSYQLLSPELQQFFARLSVFRGGWSLEAAEAVCEETLALDYLAQLRESSLILSEDIADQMQFRMLETLREYAQERLTPEEVALLKNHHVYYFVTIGEAAESALEGPKQGEWLSRLEADHDNLRAALHWTIESKATEIGLRLGNALWRFWEIHGHLSEGRRWLESVLTQEGASEHKTLWAKALGIAGNLAGDQGDFVRARSLYDESLAVRREIGDSSGVAAILNSLGNLACDQGDLATARKRYEESLTLKRESGNKAGIALTLNNMGALAYAQGDLEQAQTLFKESLELRREIGNQRDIAASLNNLASIAGDQGNYVTAQKLHEESLAIHRELGNKVGIAFSLHNLASIALKQGDTSQAYSHLRESLAILQELGDKMSIVTSFEGFADVAATQGKHEQTAVMLGAMETLRESMNTPLLPVNQVAYDRIVNAGRTALGGKAFATLLAQGRAMTLEQAIAYALGKLGELTPI